MYAEWIFIIKCYFHIFKTTDVESRLSGKDYEMRIFLVIKH